ncbi:hypothetical protein SAMN05216567_1373 [Variovorax sp. OK605]|uniref:hypothetical protein n=1 Tax=Variovorax sp. OK605 TaxID=1855317 RepID=UPI0008E24DD3|nr:hypothetical protein [Variovorax sp. OK605]SFQ74803.1 hypothetical protein SAMN05216567_1373 [Variovorax sp. OK605]
MKLRSSSSSAIAAVAWLMLAASPAFADGVPAPRAGKHAAPSHAAPLTVAARKPNDSGVTIQYSVAGVAQIGRPVSITLQFDGVTDPAGATVRLSTDAGLTLATAGTLALPAGQRTSMTATVTSDREGLAYLNVFVTQNGAMSIVAIPVQTGSAAPSMKGAGEVKSSSEGEKIISSPAKEPREPREPRELKEPKEPKEPK